MRFLLEGGDQVVEIEAARRAGVEHVGDGVVESLASVAILQGVEKKKAFDAQYVLAFVMHFGAIPWFARFGIACGEVSCIRVCGNQAKRAANRVRAFLWPVDRFARSLALELGAGSCSSGRSANMAA